MDTVPKALIASALIVGVALIVAADFLKSPYQIAGIGAAGGVYRLNQNTGDVSLCIVDSDELGSAQEAKTGVVAHCEGRAKGTSANKP